jgi:hypothetical protein
MTELNMNTRLIRSSEEGFFNAGKRTPICGSCGIQDLCARRKERLVCADFSPILAFRPPLLGLDGWSNTFRLSAIWYDRLKGKTGQTISYFDTRKGGQLIGRARLTGIARGTMDQMLERYAWSNHLSLGSGVSKEDAPEFLRKVLLKNYKTMLKKGEGQDIFTVIFSVRLRDANTQEDAEGLRGRQAA